MPKLVKPSKSSKPVEAKQDETPDTLRPYVFQGLDVSPPARGKEATCDCPFCGREGKFSINVETGQWRCFVCGGEQATGGGNIFSFLAELLKVSDQATPGNVYKELAQDRALEHSDTLVHWGVCKSVLTGNWLIPAWGRDQKDQLVVKQLYQYTTVAGRKALLPTPGIKHALLGLNLYDAAKPHIFLCEGPWDAMRLWEALGSTKQSSDGILSITASPEHCLLANSNVLAVPTCTTFNDGWADWMAGKRVSMLYDNDYPQTNERTGATIEPAGYLGMQRHAAKMSTATKEVSYLNWGPGGYDPKLPNRYDVRDALKENQLNGLELIFNRIEEVPTEWLSGKHVVADSLQCRPCNSWRKLITSWRKALKWTPGLEHGLAVMLASICSTKSIGDQLWVKIIGPASCGKSTLCEALSINKQYVIAKSTIRGFHSGFKVDAEGKEDTSLIPHIKDRTLIIKDGDTLLQSPNLPQILSEARDLYDKVSRTHYRNKMSRDYEGIQMTLILCGTASLRKIDSSELGERFLDCVVMDRIEPNIEDDILWRVVNRAANEVGIEANGEMRSQYPPALCDCMELTGGYINWLCENAAAKLPLVEFPDEFKRMCINVGKFVAFLRARPSTHQEEKAERELAARLVSVHARLAKCLAFVLNKPAVDKQVMERVKQVALDTARGTSLDVVLALYSHPGGMEYRALTLHVHASDVTLRALLRFLKAIGVVRQGAVAGKPVWILTDELIELCKKVL